MTVTQDDQRTQARAIADRYLRGHVTGVEGREAEFGRAVLTALQTISHTASYDHETNDALVSDLARAGDDDPLLLRILVEDLAAGRITPDDLSRRPPGLEPHLRAWHEEILRGVPPGSPEARAVYDLLRILGGAMGDTVLDVNGIKALAELPSLDELRAKIVGLVQAPATKIARTVAEPGAMLARVFGAYAAAEAA